MWLLARHSHFHCNNDGEHMRAADYTSWDFGLGERVRVNNDVGVVVSRSETTVNGEIRHSYRVAVRGGSQWFDKVRLERYVRPVVR